MRSLTQQGVSPHRVSFPTARMQAHLNSAKAPRLRRGALADPPTRSNRDRRASPIMMDVASDSSQGVCEYAACDLPATAEADGWDFCSRHLAEHHLIMAGEELPDLPRKLLPIPCGSEAGEAAHRRRGQAPCSECKEAKRQADYRRNATYTARWHRRKDVA